MRISFLGTGIMGAPMARHLAQAGHEVTVWNRTAEKAQPLAGHRARVAGDPAAAVAGAEVVVTMLTDGAAVEEVIRQAPGLGDGMTWWQASTVGIAATETLVRLAGELRLAWPGRWRWPRGSGWTRSCSWRRSRAARSTSATRISRRRA